jgi:tRNA1Val (adenine37-N6)-methyltransferase
MTDTFLDGRVKARQPDTGFRSGTDAVLLAAAIPAQPGQKALELGAGSGAVSLCLSARVKGVAVTGIELDASLANLARENAVASQIEAEFACADVFALPPELKRDFDQVFANPPFHGEGQAPPDPARARALMDDGTLQQWLSLGLQRTVSGGFFTAILRADRLSEALAALPKAGVNIFPVWPRTGMPAKRVILQARKGSRAPMGLLAGLALHEADGRYTAEAEAILRDGASLAMDSARL